MDYEKKYKEALERAKMILCNLGEGSGNIRDIESIFPELTESEDEIHKKWILEYLYDGLRKADEQFKDHFRSAIAWLEKQKEQKPSISCGQENDTEWSEEDEEKINIISEIIEHCISIPHSGGKGILSKEYKKELQCFIESLRPHWKPSEDEERLINTSISFLKDFADKGYENAIECIDWLKSKLNGNACK